MIRERFKTSHDKKTLKKCKWIFLFCLILGLVLTGAEIYEGSQRISELNRPGFGEGIQEERLAVQWGDEEQEIEVSVSEQAPTEEQLQAEFTRAKEEIDGSVLGQNESPDCVYEDLLLKDSYAEGAVAAIWTFDRSDLINSEGKLRWENITEESLVNVTAELTCGKQTQLYEFPIRIVLPPEDTPTGFLYRLQQELTRADMDGISERTLSLPEQLGQTELSWKKPMEYTGLKVILLGMAAVAGILLAEREEGRKAQKDHQKNLDWDYPQIVSALALYVGAGVSMRNAFRRLANDPKARDDMHHPGYAAVLQVHNAMVQGKGELEAYRELGRLTENKNYRKLALLITQNLRKGTAGLTEQLEKEEEEAFRLRTIMAKTAGEEASTKLLLPMMGLLGIVMVILIVPAVETMNF